MAIQARGQERRGQHIESSDRSFHKTKQEKKRKEDLRIHCTSAVTQRHLVKRFRTFVASSCCLGTVILPHSKNDRPKNISAFYIYVRYIAKPWCIFVGKNHFSFFRWGVERIPQFAIQVRHYPSFSVITDIFPRHITTTPGPVCMSSIHLSFILTQTEPLGILENSDAYMFSLGN